MQQIMFVNAQLLWINVKVVKSVRVEHVSVSNQLLLSLELSTQIIILIRNTKALQSKISVLF